MLGDRITERMQQIGIRSQTELAERSGLSTSAINAIIHGKRGKQMQARTLVRLARALRVSQKFLLEDSANVEKSDPIEPPQAVSVDSVRGAV